MSDCYFQNWYTVFAACGKGKFLLLSSHFTMLHRFVCLNASLECSQLVPKIYTMKHRQRRCILVLAWSPWEIIMVASRVKGYSRNVKTKLLWTRLVGKKGNIEPDDFALLYAHLLMTPSLHTRRCTLTPYPHTYIHTYCTSHITGHTSTYICMYVQTYKPIVHYTWSLHTQHTNGICHK